MTTCPICNSDTGHLNNHVRMSEGEHGEQGEYPEGWDKSAGEVLDRTDPGGEGGEGGEQSNGQDDGHDLHLGNDDLGDNQGGDDLDTLTFGDSESDTRDYECGNCEEPLAYLGGDDREGGGKECPNCGERLYWSMMDS